VARGTGEERNKRSGRDGRPGFAREEGNGRGKGCRFGKKETYERTMQAKPRKREAEGQEWVERRCPGVRVRREEGKPGQRSRTLPKEILKPVVRRLRDHTGRQYRVLTERTRVDYLGAGVGSGGRFQLVRQRRSLRWEHRRCLKVRVGEAEELPSLTERFPVANWYEREIYDRFGVSFAGHPDRRRILTDYGFEGHPRRKDFPLTGFTEVRYDEREKRVVSEPLELAQERRFFSFGRPWAEGGAPRVLRGETPSRGGSGESSG